MTGTPEIAQSTRDGVQLLGLTRFSVLTTWGFQTGFDTPDEAREFLYDPKRLDQRLAWFENVTLPSLAAQKDDAFRIIVMMSEDMPAPWRTAMEGHIAAVPQLVADYVPFGKHRPICADAIERHSDPAAEAIAQFRLDDDDAVAIDFTRRVRREFRKLKYIFRDEEMLGLDYSLGVEITVADGKVAFLPKIAQLRTAALVVFTRPGDGHHILDDDLQHHLLWQRMATVARLDSLMYLRGVHGGNDGQGRIKGKDVALDEKYVRQMMRQRFRVDPGGISKLADTLAWA